MANWGPDADIGADATASGVGFESPPRASGLGRVEAPPEHLGLPPLAPTEVICVDGARGKGRVGPSVSRELGLVPGRAELRARWRSVLALALVLGIGGGVALTAFAGARRTSSAMPQFVSYSLPDDGGFLYGSPLTPPPVSGSAGSSLAPLEKRIVSLPQVVAYFQAPYLFMTVDRTGRQAANLNVFGPAQADLYRRVDRPLVVAGSLPNPSHPFEAAVNELAAAKGHLHVGSRVRLFSYAYGQVKDGQLTATTPTRAPAPTGPAFTVRITAIVRFPQDVNAILPLATKQDVSYEGQQNLYLTPAFLPRFAVGLGIAVQQIPDVNLVGVRLRHGAADWRAFSTAANAIGRGRVFTSAGDVYNIRTAAASAERGIHLEVVALLLFGVIAALVTLLFVGQAFARQVLLESDAYATLAALGAGRAQLFALVVVRAALIGLAGGGLAVVVAVAASGLMPIGLARAAEIHPGIDVDVLVLIPGLFALAVLVTARAVFPAWRVSRRSALQGSTGIGNARLSRAAQVVARTFPSPVPSIGVRFGLGGGSHGAAPSASALVGAVAAVAALSASLTFGASLNHLIASPRQQGWNWNVLVGNPNDLNDEEAHTAALLAHNRLVGSYSAIAILAGASQGTAVIDGKTVNLLLAFDPLKGSVYPPLIEGHPPRVENQIVLADQTLRDLHRQVGQTVEIDAPQGRLVLHIVGRMIAPSVGDLFTNTMGQGGWVYGPAVRRQSDSQPPSSGATPPTVFDLFAVRYAPGVAPAAAFASLQREFGPIVLRQLPSENVVNLQSVDRLPTLLAGLVVLLGVTTMGNTLFVSVRARRRDLATLKTVGFVRRQLAGTIAWHATSFSLVAIVIGLPLGVAGGRWAWNLAVGGIGSVSPPFVPVLAVALVVPGALLAANVLAAWPGWRAARVAPAVIMRGE